MLLINVPFLLFQSISKDIPLGLNEDTLGGVLKSGIAQYVALEISRGNGRDNRAVARYLPWLYNAPSTLQQGYDYISFMSFTCHFLSCS